ncbi:unnamed protein product [Euphydryas editha]|uniref:Uncharacterized protein n=1 Tax=Euphydryas editha TaxID=104508 RepID=A0AAU9V2Y1_EUPED|nr:unnamed protein product [Euphydryas editha]
MLVEFMQYENVPNKPLANERMPQHLTVMGWTIVNTRATSPQNNTPEKNTSTQKASEHFEGYSAGIKKSAKEKITCSTKKKSLMLPYKKKNMKRNLKEKT